MRFQKSACLLALLVLTTHSLLGQVALEEGFETAAVGSIPPGWFIQFSGVSIGVVDNDAFAGFQSIRVVGRAFSGANVRTALSTTAPMVRVRYFLRTDSQAWTSGNGKADVTLRQRGRRASAGILKRNGQFFYEDDQTRATTMIPAVVDEWVKVEFELDFINEEARAFFNDVLTFVSPLTVDPGSEILDINSGNASLSGDVAAFYDEIVVEEINQVLEPVLVATNSLWLKQSSDVLSGDIVVNDASLGSTLTGFELTIGLGATTSIDSDILADSLKIKSGAFVSGNVSYNDLTNNGTIGGDESTPLDLPVVSALPPFQSSTPGSQGILILRDAIATLPPGDYGSVLVKAGGTLLFEGGLYNMSSLTAGNNSNLVFAEASEVRIEGRLSTGQGSFVGPLGGLAPSEIVFYVSGSNGTSGNLGATPKAAKVGISNAFLANLYVPNGTLWLKEDTNATGSFIARDIIVGINAQVALDSAFSQE